MSAFASPVKTRSLSSERIAVDPRRAIAAFLVVVVGTLLFWNLGHYALWDDEAYTALYGEGIWRDGDMSVQLGHNIVAFRNGQELQGLKNRLQPPLAFYLEAPFVGLLGRSAFAARLPSRCWRCSACC